MIKGILFDFDGTLSFRMQSAYKMYKRCIQIILPDKDPLEQESIIQECLYWDQYGTISKDYVYTKLKEKYKPDLDVQKWTDDWLANFPHYQIPMEGAYKTLQKLHRYYVLGILSNGDAESQKNKIHALGMDACVDAVVTTGEYGIHKPDRRIFEIAAGKMGLPCNEIAYIGDTFHRDILGASKAGMKPVWYCFEKKGVTDFDIQIVSSMKEIEQMFTEDTTWNI